MAGRCAPGEHRFPLLPADRALVYDRDAGARPRRRDRASETGVWRAMAKIDEVSQEHRDTWRSFCRLTAVIVVGVVLLLGLMALTPL